MPTLPSLVSFCRAFPPLYEDIMSLLIQIGQVCASDVATQTRDIDPIITRKWYLIFIFFHFVMFQTRTIFISEYLALIISPSSYFVGLQQIKEKPRGLSPICKDPSYKNGSRDTGSMDPDVQLCHCIESTIIEIINMSVSGI